MFDYYFMFILGSFLVIVSLFGFIDVGKRILIFLFGVLFLWVTLPSLKYVVQKEYDVVSGKCVIEIESSGRSSSANFKMLDTDEIFVFNDIPALDAYGKSIPYYCEVTATKDHMFEISYKIFNHKTRELILKSE